MRDVVPLALLLAACAPSRPPGAGVGAGAGGEYSDLGGHLGGEDLAPRNGAVVDNATIYVHEGETLYTVDPVTFNLTTIGRFDANDDMTDLAVTPEGRIFTCSRTTLYEVDPKTAKATKVIDIAASTSNVAMTFQVDGTLLAADQDGKVRVIDPSTGQVTELGTYGSGFDTAGDLVAVADGTMFGIAAKGPNATMTSNVLIKVNPQTAAAQGVGPIGYAGVFGTAYSNGRVLAFTKSGEIIRIDPFSGQGTLVKTHAGKVFYGAGTTPLVPIQ